MSDVSPEQSEFSKFALSAATTAAEILQSLESFAERLDPQRLPDLVSELRQRHGEAWRNVQEKKGTISVSDDLQSFATRFEEGLEHLDQSLSAIHSIETLSPMERIPILLGALRHHARAQEIFYLLRRPLPPLQGFWDLEGMEVEEVEAHQGTPDGPPTGVVHVGRGGHHGGFSYYIPEYYRPNRPWPLIVALHGGSGNGRDFLWTWLREARSRGYMLLAPSSASDTWSESDDEGLFEILNWLGRQYRLDAERILLTGLSDGATFSLLFGLAHPKVYRGIAALCGVLHPANEHIGNLERAKGHPIYLVHGTRDFLFPVEVARMARDTLELAGAGLTYRELPELSHTYPRSENTKILDWFERMTINYEATSTST